MDRFLLSKYTSALGVLILVAAAATCVSAVDHPKPPALWDGLDARSGQRSVQSNGAAKKSCSEVFPIPEAQKHWSQCEEIEASECGGPPQCACKLDARLVRFQCKEGSYAACVEDDKTCIDDD
jgi:hypothetical protein